MKITVNGVNVELPEGATLQDALNTRSIPAQGIATAVNDHVIPAAQRADKSLAEGDKVVIIKAFYGG
ncbi:MAG: sulfur carrier protein ThiS [Duncaniella sp.]|nr:sulfur carrier protein ThiS [Duncaniella sp.]